MMSSDRTPSDDRNRPSVVIFFTDEQRWDSTGIHGNPLDLTPHFDRFCREGTHLANHFTCQPVCTPARACLQTGVHGATSGVFRNEQVLPESLPTLADLFREAGYFTGYIGKWHLAGMLGQQPPADLPAGDWFEWFVNINQTQPIPHELRGGYEFWLAANILEFSSSSYDTRVFDTDGNIVKLPGYRVDALTDAAIRFLHDNRDRSFFLMLSLLEPHPENFTGKYTAPDGYRERYAGRWVPPDLAALGGRTHAQLGGYWGMVKRIDEAFGRLLDALKSLGLDRNTIVLFTSDHGEHFSTRHAGAKCSCHESSIRIPCGLIGPGFTGEGRIRELTSLLDLPPTLLNACGLDIPEHMQGHSVLPLLRGQNSGWPREVLVQICGHEHVERAIRTRRWTYCVEAPDTNSATDGTGSRYVEKHLYDLQADPHQLQDLAGYESHRKLADELKQRLIARMAEAGETEPVIENAPPRPSGQRRVHNHEET